jgi:prepilin-type processing-associated H-X9-DG protein
LLTILSAVLVILTCMGFAVPVDFAVAVVLGWIWYLARTYPAVHVAPEGVATAAVCLVLFIVGSHLFLGWLYTAVRNRAGTTAPRGERWKWRWTCGLTALIVLMFVAGMSVVGMTHQLGWLLRSKEPLVVNSGSLPGGALARAISTNNLKQIGLALHLYHQAYDSLPPGGTFDRRGRPLVSWQTTILPYLEVGDLYDRIDLSIPWNDLRNAHAYETEVPQYLRPGIPATRDAAGYALSHFAANVYMLGGDHPRKFEEVSDGTANTLMAGEVTEGFKAWGDPTNWRDPTLGLNTNPRGFASPSPDGVNFLMVDGSVRFIENNVDPKVLKLLSTPAGGETFPSQY